MSSRKNSSISKSRLNVKITQQKCQNKQNSKNDKCNIISSDKDNQDAKESIKKEITDELLPIQVHCIMKQKEYGAVVEDSFLRENEKAKISSFIDSSSNILHITGSPGTGKTITVKYMLRNTKYTYINYILNNKMDKTENIIVFDEFDKFYNSKRTECLNFLQKYSRNKIITISNDLLFNKDCLFFKPYTKREIIEIVRKKINSEKIDDVLIDIVSSKESYDLRRVINVFNNLLLQKKEKITLDDLKYTQNKQLSIHQQIIHEIRREFIEKRLAFKNYIEKCRILKIKGLNRIDFLSIYENMDWCL